MTTVFIAGSISINHLHEKVQERINKIVSSNFNVVVGDADGADTSIQKCLNDNRANKVTVYCTGEKPRNNLADWPVHHVHSKARIGSRDYFTAKDLVMTQNSDYGLMVWDCKSTGTLSNVIELLRFKKKSVVFVSKCKDFVNVSNRSSLETLLSFMSEQARAKAEEKIELTAKIAGLEQEQFSLEISSNTRPSPQLDDANSSAGASTNDSNLTDNMRLRSQLMLELKEHISRMHLNQSQAAELFGVTQPRISDLTRGKVDLFGLDALVNMASTARLRVELHVCAPEQAS